MERCGPRGLFWGAAGVSPGCSGGSGPALPWALGGSLKGDGFGGFQRIFCTAQGRTQPITSRAFTRNPVPNGA